MKNKYLTALFVLISTISAQEGARYLIITHDNFYVPIVSFADWKTQKGIKTLVKKLSEVGSTPTAIKSYITNAYNTWNPRPEYLLLVGSPNLLPSSNSTDDYYANITGDYQIELCVGRFHCATLAQCSLMVTKSIGYEKSATMHDSTWFCKGTTIVLEDYTPDPYYQPDCRYIRNLWLGAGYAHVDSFISTRNHNQDSVINAINNGRAFVVFRGQSVSYWWSPFNVNPNNTNNGYKLPVVISGTCATMTLASGENMLGDAFLRAGTVGNPKGAVGFFGTTLVGSHVSQYRGTVAKGFFRALYQDSILTMGGAAKRAKFILDSIYHVQDRYREWNLLGDPELNLWTSTPQIITVTYDTFVPCHVSQLNVTVMANGEPVRNAQVCVWKQNDFHIVGYTNNSGEAILEINPQSLGDFLITVTGRNCFPFEGTGLVRTADVGVLSVNNLINPADSGMVLLPQALVKNYGSTAVSFPVNFVGDSFVSTRIVSNLLPDSACLVEFDSWTLVNRGYVNYQCSTAMVGDENMANDFEGDTIFVRVCDVGVSQILSPVDTLFIGDTIIPLVRIENYGNTQDSFNVRFRIYSDSGNTQIVYEANQILKFNSEGDTILSFPPWVTTEEGNYSSQSKTELTNDMHPENDSLVQSFQVIPLTGVLEKPNTTQVIGLKILPNPFSDKVIIKYGTINNPKSRLKIFDVTGKLVKEFHLLPNMQEVKLVWDCTDYFGKRLNQGIYFIQINDLAISDKLLKIH